MPSPSCEGGHTVMKGFLVFLGTLPVAGQELLEEVAVVLIAEPLAESFRLSLPSWPPGEGAEAVPQDAVQDVLHTRDAEGQWEEQRVPITDWP
eukprot:11228365-Lingulodinium_polyedra.AAC.2